jgi:uncharacterized membrane protein (UPF0182 family)
MESTGSVKKRDLNLPLYISLAIILVIIVLAMFSAVSLRQKGVILVISLILAAVLAALLAVMWHHNVRESIVIAVAVIGVVLIAVYVYGSIYTL